MSSIAFIVENEMKKYRSFFQTYCSRPMMVPRGINICQQCETANWLYYLLDGVCRVYITNSEGDQYLLEYMKEDTLIGMDCIVEGEKSVVSIQAITEVHVLPFNHSILKRMMADDPEFAFDFSVYYGKVLRQVSFNAGNLSNRNHLIRLCNLLYFLSDTRTYKETGQIKMTQEEIARSINTSRAEIAKLISKLKSEKIIETGRGHILILDLVKLEAYTG